MEGVVFNARGKAILDILRGTRAGGAVEIADIAPSYVSRDLVAELVGWRVGREVGSISLSPAQRLNLAIEVIKSGMDVVPVSRNLSWKEFEWLACEAFEANHFKALRNVRFSQNRTRFEIDIMAVREPVGLVVDCKKWRRSPRSSLMSAGARQFERTLSLAAALEASQVDVGISDLDGISLVPMVLTLGDVPQRIAGGSLIVPILRLKSFLTEFPTRAGILLLARDMDLRVIKARISHQNVLDSYAARKSGRSL